MCAPVPERTTERVLCGGYRSSRAAVGHVRFANPVGVVAGRGSKREAIRQFVRQSITDEFTVADVRRAAPAASQAYISKTLASMRDESLIEPIGTGKSARWRRLRSDF